MDDKAETLKAASEILKTFDAVKSFFLSHRLFILPAPLLSFSPHSYPKVPSFCPGVLP